MIAHQTVPQPREDRLEVFEALDQLLGVDQFGGEQRLASFRATAVDSGVRGSAEAATGRSVTLSVVQLRETVVGADADAAVDSDPPRRTAAAAVCADSVCGTLAGTGKDGEGGIEALSGIAAPVEDGHDARMGVHLHGEGRLRRAVGAQQVVGTRPALLQQHKVRQTVVDVDVVHRAIDLCALVDRQLDDGITLPIYHTQDNNNNKVTV